MSNIIRIDANVVWEVAYDHDSGMWIGVCPMLNLNALGETQEEMQECANEAIQALFEDLFLTGELDDFLHENNWTYHGGPVAGKQPPRFDVPFEVKHRPIEAVTAAVGA